MGITKDLKKWVLSQQSKLDEITAGACREFWKKQKDKENFAYDLKCSHGECFNLSKGKDLCYDRVTTALAYTLWYHPRRVNTFLSYFIDHLKYLQGREIQLFDLGAGTGAVQWAVLLVANGLREMGENPPHIHIVNIDTSPFMLHFNRNYLWKNFVRKYGSTGLKVKYEVNSWSNDRDLSQVETIIAASYLFDASENMRSSKKGFMNMVNKYDPSALLLLTSKNKFNHLKDIAYDLKDIGYDINEDLAEKLLFKDSGSLSEVNKLREELARKYEIQPLNPAKWEDHSYNGMVASKPYQREMDESISKPIDDINLHNPPIKVISDISLNKDQKKAAKFSDRPSVIVGPAGSGKSIVIVRKIINTMEANKGKKDLSILVTTFNKAVIKQLKDWLLELEPKKIKIIDSEDGYVKVRVSNQSNHVITLINFDKLPTRIGGISRKYIVSKACTEKIMCNSVAEFKQENKISGDEHEYILNTDFLLEEYHRIIYGLEIKNWKGIDGYKKVRRFGRGAALQRKQRDIVFQILKKYTRRAKGEGEKRFYSFTLMRQSFLSDLKNNRVKQKYDFIFVDEFQDCTRADFKIFSLLLKDPNHLCVAGDLAQAVQIGKSARLPRFDLDYNWKSERLKGSYRLPLRISEAISPISKDIQKQRREEGEGEGSEVVTPYRGSPPGSRPIVVYASSLDAMVSKILQIYRAYKKYDVDTLSILEEDKGLNQGLTKKGMKAEADTILRIKGLEKRCVVWSTRKGIKQKKEVYESIYTILSRTSGILIIALFDETQDIYKPIINRLNKERLIFWDEETESKFPDFCKVTENIADTGLSIR